MGRKTPTSQIYASAYYPRATAPESLEREIVKDSQVRWDENTIIWGDHDALPLVILDAINKSPTTTICLGKVASFMRGSGFTDEGLMSMPIDKNGTTLWEFHQELVQYMTKLEGFSVRFTYNYDGQITNAYPLATQSIRFVKPQASRSKTISQVKYNPYFGTQEFKVEDSDLYHVFDLEAVEEEIKQYGNTYNGQVYFYGSIRPPFMFYPVPRYWAGEKWIYTDAYVQSFVKEQLDNGFFQSVLLNMIGDPTQKSQNPKYQREVTGTDGVKRKESNGTTVGEEFNEMMQHNFSGHKKAGTAMVLWSKNLNETPKIQSFPTGANLELIGGTMDRAIRGIAIACEVQAILANLPQQGSSLGSDGDSMRAAVELMYSRVRDEQVVLEQFYNNILLPNFANKTKARVKIKQFQPLSNQIQVPDKVWEWMNDAEKAEFVKANMPQVTLVRTVTPAAPAPTPDGNTAPTETPNVDQGATPPAEQIAPPAGNDALKNLNISDLNKVQKIVARYNLSLTDPANSKALTYEQAYQFIKAFGFTDEQVNAWLVKPEEI